MILTAAVLPSAAFLLEAVHKLCSIVLYGLPEGFGAFFVIFEAGLGYAVPIDCVGAFHHKGLPLNVQKKYLLLLDLHAIMIVELVAVVVYSPMGM